MDWREFSNSVSSWVAVPGGANPDSGSSPLREIKETDQNPMVKKNRIPEPTFEKQSRSESVLIKFTYFSLK